MSDCSYCRVDHEDFLLMNGLCPQCALEANAEWEEFELVYNGVIDEPRGMKNE